MYSVFIVLCRVVLQVLVSNISICGYSFGCPWAGWIDDVRILSCDLSLGWIKKLETVNFFLKVLNILWKAICLTLFGLIQPFLYLYFLGKQVELFLFCRWWKKYSFISLGQVHLCLQWFKYWLTLLHLMVHCLMRYIHFYFFFWLAFGWVV